MVPPERGIEERIAGLELCDLRRVQRLAEARIALEIGVLEIDHADNLPAWRWLERSGIEVCDLLGREEGEAPLPDKATGDIVRHVIMRCCRRAIADPDADDWWIALEHRVVQGEIVRGPKARKIEVSIGRTDIIGRGIRIAEMRADTIQIVAELTPSALEIQAGHVLIVEIAPLDLGRACIADDRAPLVVGQEMRHRSLWRLAARARKRPVFCHALQDRRRLLPDQLFIGNRIRGEAFNDPCLSLYVDHHVPRPMTKLAQIRRASRS